MTNLSTYKLFEIKFPINVTNLLARIDYLHLTQQDFVDIQKYI